MNWKQWFVQLSGWPVFLTTVAAFLLFAIAMTVVLPRLGHRSVLQNAVLAVVAIAVIGLGILGLVAVLSRW